MSTITKRTIAKATKTKPTTKRKAGVTVSELSRAYDMTVLMGLTPHRALNLDELAATVGPGTLLHLHLLFIENANTGYDGPLYCWALPVGPTYGEFGGATIDLHPEILVTANVEGHIIAVGPKSEDELRALFNEHFREVHKKGDLLVQSMKTLELDTDAQHAYAMAREKADAELVE